VFGHTWACTRQYTTEMIRSGFDGVMHVLGILPPDRRPEPVSIEGLWDWEAHWLASATAWLEAAEAEVEAPIRLMVEHDSGSNRPSPRKRRS
jgi:hypothetical protein